MTSPIRASFALPPGVSYFEHGGYSLPLQAVLRFQATTQARINQNPSGYFRYQMLDELQAVRTKLTAFLHAKAGNLCFLPNATYAMATVFRNIAWQPGDKVLITSQTFYATRIALTQLTTEVGIELKDVPIALPVTRADELLRAFEAGYEPGVKVAIIEHIASPSGMVFPVQAICEFLRSKGVITIVDGAQSPGQIPLDLDAIPFDFYMGNGHKWLTGLRTSAFLLVADAWSASFRGLITARRGDLAQAGRSPAQVDTDWPGAYDPLPILSLSESLDQLGQLYPGSFAQLFAENHAGLIRGAEQIARRVALSPVAEPQLFASMGLFRLHDRYRLDAQALQRQLFADGVMTMVSTDAEQNLLIRLCHQAYLDHDDYERVADALVRYRL